MIPDEPHKKDDNTLAAAVVPTEAGARDKKKLNWVIIILLILLLLLALIFGWIWWKDKDTTTPAVNEEEQTSQSPPAAVAPGCEAGLTEYQDEPLDIRFCYPDAWGDVHKTDAKFAAADAGSRWRLSFSSKEQVNLGVVSPDWSTDVPRDGVCVDPALQPLPPFAPFSTTWTPTGTPAMSGTRGIEVSSGEYLIEEHVDDLLTSGVCLEGYKVVDNVFEHAATSYFAEFSGAVMTPDQHIANPNLLIPAGDRTDFALFTKSITAIE